MKISILCRSARIYISVSTLICFAFFVQLNSVYAETKNPVETETLHVISDKMVAQKDSSMVEFIGNVKATRIDSIVYADSIKIYFIDDDKNKDADAENKDADAENKDAQRNVKKIISTGNVRYTAGKRKAFADKAVYTTDDQILVLTGKSPRLLTGSSFITGKKITLFRSQGKAIVESDSTKRVEAFFNPEDKITEKNMSDTQ